MILVHITLQAATEATIDISGPDFRALGTRYQQDSYCGGAQRHQDHEDHQDREKISQPRLWTIEQEPKACVRAATTRSLK
jgi:hypothetical protein